MAIAHVREGLTIQILNWIQHLKLIGGQTYRIRMHIANGIFEKGVTESEKKQSDVFALNKVDLNPILNRVKRSLLRMELSSAEVEVTIATNHEGQIIEGDIFIRSGFANDLP